MTRSTSQQLSASKRKNLSALPKQAPQSLTSRRQAGPARAHGKRSKRANSHRNSLISKTRWIQTVTSGVVFYRDPPDPHTRQLPRSQNLEVDTAQVTTRCKLFSWRTRPLARSSSSTPSGRRGARLTIAHHFKTAQFRPLNTKRSPSCDPSCYNCRKEIRPLSPCHRVAKPSRFSTMRTRNTFRSSAKS